MNIIKKIAAAKRECAELGLEFDMSDVGNILYNEAWDVAMNFVCTFGRKRHCYSHYWDKKGFVVTHPMNKTKWFVWYDDCDQRCFGTYDSLAERKAKTMRERGIYD